MTSFNQRFNGLLDNQMPIAGWLGAILTQPDVPFYNPAPSQGFGPVGLLAPDDMSSQRAITPASQPRAAPMLDSDANPIPGQQAVPSAPSMAVPAAQPVSGEGGPGLLQRLAGTGGLIGGIANTLGAIVGQTGSINPETSKGPAGQAYRMMIAKGLDKDTARFLASRQDTAMAWIAKNLSPQEMTTDMKNFLAASQNPAFKDFMKEMKTAGATVIKNEGNIPPGYQVVRDDQGRPVRLEPIPGSPAALEAEEKLRKTQLEKQQRQMTSEIVTQDVARAIDIAERSPWATGQLGELLARWKGSDADNLRSLVTTLEANAAFDKLQAMRAASPTGGALGNVSNQENQMLASTLGALKASQSKEQFIYNLKRFHNIYNDIVHGPGQGPQRYDLNTPAGAPRASGKTRSGLQWSVE